jgi:hypothetical protein
VEGEPSHLLTYKLPSIRTPHTKILKKKTIKEKKIFKGCIGKMKDKLQ